MPYDKIKKGKNKGKYRSRVSGRIRTLSSIQAEHASKARKRKRHK